MVVDVLLGGERPLRPMDLAEAVAGGQMRAQRPGDRPGHGVPTAAARAGNQPSWDQAPSPSAWVYHQLVEVAVPGQHHGLQGVEVTQ